MGCSWCLKRAYMLQLDGLRAEVIEEANALTQENMGNAHIEFIEQAHLQCLLGRTGTVKGNRFFARESLCLRNRAFNAIGDEVKLCLALFHRLSRLRL